jgi:Asp-tRNA(Asn)/Glu-tRNA(Gln) amidotransferase A subunit family amidase
VSAPVPAKQRPAAIAAHLEQRLHGLEISRRPLKSILWGIASKSFASLDLTERMLERSARVDPHLKAYIEVMADEARIAAAAADAEMRSGKYRGPCIEFPSPSRRHLM